MGYMKIQPLYKAQDILLFKECFALEKLHGSSAHITWKDDDVHFQAGGAKHEHFVNLFDYAGLIAAFQSLGHPNVVVFGEAYGGKMQGMKETYGPDMKFCAFEVKIGETWLYVKDAADVAQKLGLEFVPYVRTLTTLGALDFLRDADSVQAVRNGCGLGHQREGIVLRPPIEVRGSNGERIMAKYKGDKFDETATPRRVSSRQQAVRVEAQEIAREWVTPNRMANVLSAFPPDVGIESTGDVIKAMLADVLTEAGEEIVDSKPARKAMSGAAARLFKEKLQASLQEAV